MTAKKRPKAARSEQATRSIELAREQSLTELEQALADREQLSGDRDQIRIDLEQFNHDEQREIDVSTNGYTANPVLDDRQDRIDREQLTRDIGQEALDHAQGGRDSQQTALDEARIVLELPSAAEPAATDANALRRGAIDRAAAGRVRAEAALIRAQAAMLRAQSAEARARAFEQHTV